ncbi:META domain-containing protein [Aquimarina sp. RZ0]|uniref:META domain-containing protein n=1 Tax=Aquimarina sp. RZ0 TaxID=2607730 RepID=UPI0011F36C46|nr:META domain-containing protein [Aquimarina sp. RZ0]KAA1246770.1 META domain-containing protein [Aquimarina sp. RZ0]
MKHLFLLFIAIVLFNNCNSTKAANSKNDEGSTQSEPEGTYLVTTLYGADVSELKVTMTFDNKNKTVSGYSGCNTYSCSYEQLEGGSVTFGIPNASKRMCLENTKVEKTFFKALSNSKKNSAKELGYIFKNTDDEPILDTKKIQ